MTLSIRVQTAWWIVKTGFLNRLKIESKALTKVNQSNVSWTFEILLLGIAPGEAAGFIGRGIERKFKVSPFFRKT
jgi:hypothetical protein